MSIKRLFFLFVSVILLSSCSIQKRQHLPGFHVNWHRSKTSDSVDSKRQPLNNADNQESKNHKSHETELLASLDRSEISAKPWYAKEVNLFVNALASKDSCDRIIDKEGDEILAKVTEIGIDVIKYKKCNHLDGPIYNIPKSAVLMIDYANGSREVIKQDKKPDPKNAEPDYSNVDNVYNDSYRTTRQDRRRVEGLGLAGFITTLVSVPIWWLVSWIGGLVGGIIGIIFGAIGISRCKKNPSLTGKGFAITSLVIGIVIAALSVILAIIIF